MRLNRYIGNKKFEYAIVDDEDFERIKKITPNNWFISHSHNVAVDFMIDVGKSKRIILKRFIMNLNNMKKRVKHKNSNFLDIRKSNLFIQ